MSSDEEIASDVDNDEGALLGKDIYEYEEEQAEEESQKNKRYDPVRVDKSEYEMTDDLSDEFQVRRDILFIYFMNLIFQFKVHIKLWIFHKLDWLIVKQTRYIHSF